MSFSGPQAVQTIFNFGNVTFDRVNETFANVSTSLTNYVRQNGAKDFSAPALGAVAQDKTCIAIRWPWLAFPAALVLLTLTFVVIVVLETRPTGARPDIWKSSPLALLYHGLGHQDGSALRTWAGRDVDHIGGMQALALAMTVKLSSSLDKGTFLEVQKDN